MNFEEAKCQLLKGTLLVAGVSAGLATVYSLTHLYQKGVETYDTYKQKERLEEYIAQDSRFENGYTLTKFCVDIYSNAQKERK